MVQSLFCVCTPIPKKLFYFLFFFHSTAAHTICSIYYESLVNPVIIMAIGHLKSKTSSGWGGGQLTREALQSKFCACTLVPQNATDEFLYFFHHNIAWTFVSLIRDCDVNPSLAAASSAMQKRNGPTPAARIGRRRDFFYFAPLLLKEVIDRYTYFFHFKMHNSIMIKCWKFDISRMIMA